MKNHINKIVQLIFLTSIFVFVLIPGIFASPPLVEIKTELVIDNITTYGSMDSLFTSDNKIFFGQGERCSIINLDTLNIKVTDPKNEIFRIRGEDEYGLLIIRDNQEPDSYFYGFYIYNPNTKVYSPFRFNNVIRSNIKYYRHYIGTQYFITGPDGEGGGYTKLYDLEKRDNGINIGAYVSDVSDDKQNFIIVGNGQIMLYNLHKRKATYIYNPRGSNQYFDDNEISMIYFINNEYIILRKSSIHDIYSVYNIGGDEVLRLQYVSPNPNDDSPFIKIRDSEYGLFLGPDLVKAIGERQALEDFGILFRQTTGTVNDNRGKSKRSASC